MERSIWLGAAVALGSVSCSAGGGPGTVAGASPVMTGVETDGGNASGGGGTGGTGSAGSGGSTGAATTGGGSGQDLCEQFVARADQVIPDLLIVLDKSASMVWPGCAAAGDPILAGCRNGVSTTPPYQAPFDRWAPSVAALEATTAALQARVRFGLMLFPDVPLPGAFPPFTNQGCQPGTILVAPGLNTAAQIAAALDAETADGDSTPIPGTLRAAHASLGTALVGPDAVPTPKYILLVTDGAPNCSVDGQQAPSIEQANLQSYAEIDSLTADGIKTFVIGYDTRATASLAVVLDEMARRGGTGEQQHREVTDEGSLLDAIAAIAGQVTSCTYQLDMAPPDAKKVRVTLDGQDRMRGPDGWELTGERTIELLGATCTEIQNAETQHTLKINVECRDVVIE